jgi:murein DD-endopeptidase MepM/ murein hydrolase activator NlpD
LGGVGLAAKAIVRGALAVTALALLCAGCASTPDGPVHVLRPGENLYRLSRYYDVSVERIRRANDIDEVTELRVGRQLLIPGAVRRQPEGTLAAANGHVRSPAGPRGSRRIEAQRELDLDFSWPLSSRLSSKFGRRWGRRHDGIDLPAKSGTAIRAAEAGRVIHSGRGLGAYGNVVIVKHAGQYSTVYAHNRRNHVSKGEFVEKGQVIAEVGKTGNASGHHLHFEVRRNRRPEDPLMYLP